MEIIDLSTGLHVSRVKVIAHRDELERLAEGLADLLNDRSFEAAGTVQSGAGWGTSIEFEKAEQASRPRPLGSPRAEPPL